MSLFDLFSNKGKKINQPSAKQVVGRIGEDFACEYLNNNGFKVLDRNYLKKWGEIDIVAKKDDLLHFVEVKTVSRDTFDENLNKNIGIYDKVAHETPVAEQSPLRGDADDNHRPEDNIHPWKLQRLGRVIQSYLLDKDVSDETEWQFDVVTVYLDRNKRLIKIEMLDDIVL